VLIRYYPSLALVPHLYSISPHFHPQIASFHLWYPQATDTITIFCLPGLGTRNDDPALGCDNLECTRLNCLINYKKNYFKLVGSFNRDCSNQPIMLKHSIVFIHGLWMHASSWQPWMDFFNQHGYDTINPGWPGDADSIEACRANPEAIANRGVVEIANHYAGIISNMQNPPIVIGHSFGGLLTQVLLGRGIAAAGIAIDPAPIKGVWQLPFSALKSSLPVLANPFNLKKAVSLSFKQFRYGFANALPEQEAKDLFARWTIPAPARPLFQAAFASIAGSETAVDTTNASRGPLLITGGGNDHIAPPVFGRASAKKYPSSRVTDFKLFEGRGHSLIVDHGWQEVAQYSLDWLVKQGF
jgi:non-heme chloroperoxidase